MSGRHPFLDALAQAWPLERWRDVTVLVAVSGGADSVALLRGLAELRNTQGDGRLVVGHFNHQLRGAESDVDEQFVRELSRSLGCEAYCGKPLGNLAAAGSPDGREGAARAARYDFLAAAAAQCGARYIATAHTADDQVETVLHNVLRGTGLAGVAGIPRIRRLTDSATLVRPMLDVTRAEVLAYLAHLGQTFRIDSSNADLLFTRNRIRHCWLPLLENEFNPQVRAALLRLARIAADADDYLDQQAQTLLARVQTPIVGGSALKTDPLAAAHPALARHALRLVWTEQAWPLQDMTFEKWEELRLLAVTPVRPGDQPHRQTFPGGIRAEKRAGELLLASPATSQ